MKETFYNHRLNYRTVPTSLNGEFLAWDWDRRDESPLFKEAKEAANAAEKGIFDYAEKVGLKIELENIREAKRGHQPRWYKPRYKAIVPEIPFHLRPNGDAENYFILWEVEKWETIYAPARAPGDPLLLERIAHPIYVVVAQWDLTELEKRLLESFRRS